jgi:hypothetical protein
VVLVAEGDPGEPTVCGSVAPGSDTPGSVAAGVRIAARPFERSSFCCAAKTDRFNPRRLCNARLVTRTIRSQRSTSSRTSAGGIAPDGDTGGGGSSTS